MADTDDVFLNWGLKHFSNGAGIDLSAQAEARFREHYAPIARFISRNGDVWKQTRPELAGWLRLQGQVAAIAAQCREDPEVGPEDFDAAVRFIDENKTESGTSFCRADAQPE